MLVRCLGLAASAAVGIAGSAIAFEISSPSFPDGKWDKKYVGDNRRL